MIFPRCKKDFDNKSLEKLLIERQKIIKDIMIIEKSEFLHKNSKSQKFETKTLMDPDPEIIWQVLNDDLIMITKLIKEKYKTSKQL